MKCLKMLVLFSLVLLFNKIAGDEAQQASEDVLVFTVATDQTDGFLRYLYSAERYKINPNVLGMGQEWKGGSDLRTKPGGGWKVNLLKAALKPYREQSNKIVLFTDAYDVMFLSDLDAIVKKFKSFDVRVLFGAEKFCWPDAELSSLYPEVTEGSPYLNSGMFIGYVPEIMKLLGREPIKDLDDDQLFFTKAYLDEKLRKKLKMKLDHKSELFQNLNGATDEVEAVEQEVVKESGEEYKFKNSAFATEPLIVHGNGVSKIVLNALGNYLADSWSSKDGCKFCLQNQVSLEKSKKLPTVLLAVFVEYATPFFEEFLNKLDALDYPKESMHLFIHNTAKYHTKDVKEFIGKHGEKYKSVKQILPADSVMEWQARDLSLDYCLSKKCDFYFSVDSIAHLDNKHSLSLLIEQNRSFVGPILTRPGKSWSNFWGALTSDGYYARSKDYMDIVHDELRGLWNVPFIANCYLMKADTLKKYTRKQINFERDSLDPDMAFCSRLRDLDVFMYASNRLYFGHLVNPESFDVTRVEPDMYQILDNEKDWEERYIHEDYPENFNAENKPAQPCPDVYWFPIVTKRFCTGLINMMENFGKWSDGSNQDKRLEGGYEAVPTRDIHMNQVGWEQHWLYFLKRYVRPLQESVFLGYHHDPPKSLMNFVVRYRPDEQPSLRPHHDSSTYTVNIALNEAGIDYEGGGCRFIRYNCSVTQTKTGWVLMHPGRLTHYHEGLLVTKGTRYIMISFVDP